jgi:hypothetical protein
MRKKNSWPDGITMGDPQSFGCDVYYHNQKIGTYHRVNSNYPPSVETLEGRQIGCKNEREALEALLAAHRTEALGVDLDGCIFPDDLFILRINDISLNCDYDPRKPVLIVAKVSVNSHKTTGSSAASKPVINSIMKINMETGQFFHNGKEQKFANQGEILKKLNDHFYAAFEKAVS